MLAASEKRLLISLAESLPLWVTPDRLTAFGILGAFFVFVGYWATLASPAFLALASIGLVMNWLGDSLDGTVARVRFLERPRYGFFVDHTGDLISQILIGVGFGLSAYIKMPNALLLLAGYLAFAAYTFIRARVFDVVMIAYSSVGPTETRLALVAANIGLFFIPALSQPVQGLDTSPADAVCLLLAFSSLIVLIRQMHTDWKVLLGEEQAAFRKTSHQREMNQSL